MARRAGPIVALERVGHAESVEYAADAVDAEAPEGTFAVLVDQLLESAQLMRSSRVELEFAALPARPGIGCDPEEFGRSAWSGRRVHVAGRPGPDPSCWRLSVYTSRLGPRARASFIRHESPT